MDPQHWYLQIQFKILLYENFFGTVLNFLTVRSNYIRTCPSQQLLYERFTTKFSIIVNSLTVAGRLGLGSTIVEKTVNTLMMGPGEN
jgi:hypothetical protein